MYVKAALVALTLILTTLAQPALAAPFAEFERDLRSVYATYRTALFATNQNSVEDSGRAVAALGEGWTRLAAKWAKAAPPQYADDPGFANTLAQAGSAIAAAAGQIARGELGPAHLTLEKIRDELGALRARNNVSTYSDRMNEYHEAMEKTVERQKTEISPAVLVELREEAAVLAYLGERLSAAPPDMDGAADFPALLGALRASVKTLRAAVAASDVEATKRALQGLKKPYAMLFMKFG